MHIVQAASVLSQRKIIHGHMPGIASQWRGLIGHVPLIQARNTRGVPRDGDGRGEAGSAQGLTVFTARCWGTGIRQVKEDTKKRKTVDERESRTIKKVKNVMSLS